MPKTQVYNGPRVVKFISTMRKLFLVKNDFCTKKSQNASIMHNLCLIMIAAKDTIFIHLLCITLPKLHVKFQPHPLKIF